MALTKSEIKKLPKSRKEAKLVGSIRYVGTPCKKYSHTIRLTSSGACFECKQAHNKKSSNDNPESRAKYQKQWRENNKKSSKDNPESRAEYHKQWREDNKEHRKEYERQYNKQYRKDNKERKKLYNKRWKENNKKSNAEYNKKYQKENRDKVNANNALRRARIAKATPLWVAPPYKQKESEEQKERYKDIRKQMQTEIRKFYTEAERLTKDTGIKHEVDHIYSLCEDPDGNQSGLHTPYNLQVITKSANISKSNKLPNDIHSYHLNPINTNREEFDPEQAILDLPM